MLVAPRDRVPANRNVEIGRARIVQDSIGAVFDRVVLDGYVRSTSDDGRSEVAARLASIMVRDTRVLANVRYRKILDDIVRTSDHVNACRISIVGQPAAVGRVLDRAVCAVQGNPGLVYDLKGCTASAAELRAGEGSSRIAGKNKRVTARSATFK